VDYGGPVSGGLLDPRYKLYRTPGIDGVVGYRRGWGCAVVIGDPVCAPNDTVGLAESFRKFNRARGSRTVYAAASEGFARTAAARGFAAVEFGEELIVDPRRDPKAGPHGRELRKKVIHAMREGVRVREYRDDERDTALERAMDQVAAAWLGARRGPQIYIARVRLFDHRSARRWFYATVGQHVVGVLAMLRMGARDGYLLEHLVAAPGAPSGTTELVATGGLAALGAEGCGFATFGPAPAGRLGAVQNLGAASEAVARLVFDSAARVFHLDARGHYRRKFQVARSEPVFLLFDPPRIGPREALGVLGAFNASIAR
jgi:lysylphosphatidylglycerol synthetase-like protein (DUF2156 family)